MGLSLVDVPKPKARIELSSFTSNRRLYRILRLHELRAFSIANTRLDVYVDLLYIIIIILLYLFYIFYAPFLCRRWPTLSYYYYFITFFYALPQ